MLQIVSVVAARIRAGMAYLEQSALFSREYKKFPIEEHKKRLLTQPFFIFRQNLLRTGGVFYAPLEL